MITREQFERTQAWAAEMLARAGIAITPEERANIEVADLGLGELEKIGVQIVVYVNTERCCAKELIMMPGQTCPEHWHPVVGDYPGKEETFRCRWGEMYLHVHGEPTPNPKAVKPAGSEQYFTAEHEIVLRPGDQYTMPPNTPHWFQGGPEGCVVSEFSTKSMDETDVFTDPRIKRAPEIEK
jgi:D-lyxose ketol-isomerase